MFRKKKKIAGPELIPVPAELPPIEGLEMFDDATLHRRPRVWLWTLIAALAVTLLVAYVLLMAGLGIYNGLKDRAVEHLQIAQEHYELGLAHLTEGDYELAIAEFELALRNDSSLRDARAQLQEAKELARAEATPTSETRQDAARLLYRDAVTHYEAGSLTAAIEVLDELRGLDPDYQRANVELMITTAHYQLGLSALQEDRLDDAAGHFEAVLVVKPDDADAQNQLNLLNLYTVALSHWERDWPAAIQALKGLYALAPDYEDVQLRLHDAYGHRAEAFSESGDWCRAAEEYAAALQILPLEATADKRDDADLRCQATAEAAAATPTPPATPTPTARPTTSATAAATAGARATASAAITPTPATQTAFAGQGQIAFASFDAARQRHDLYVVDLAQGDARLLQANASQPAFAPGGKRLVFRNYDPLHLGLAVLDLRTNEISELTTHVEDTTPIWSPDARQIVFASNKHGDRKWRIYAIAPGEIRGEGEEWAFGQLPSWSPDGASGEGQIAYRGCDERGDNCGVWVMLAGGFEPGRLTTEACDTAPAWSPNGQQIAFVSSRAGNWEIYLIDVASGRETRLTDDSAADVAPTWSPDGKRLAFLSDREGSWALYIMEVKSGQLQKIIATGDAYPDPVGERLSWVP
jgi:TolB protein